MTTAWSHLPNAEHIDRVLVSLKPNPEKWNAARNAAWEAAAGVAYNTAREMARNVARDAAWSAASEVTWDAVRGVARNAAWEAAMGAILALIAYDDCAYMLDSDVNEIKILAALGDPRAILLLPACIVFNEIK